LKNRVQEKAQNLVEESALATAAMLGAGIAAKTANEQGGGVDHPVLR
jgi:hypothetical protein